MDETKWNTVSRGSSKLITFNIPKEPITRTKVAMFDMDDTLIKFFSKNYNAVQLMYSNVPIKLQQLEEDGYMIIIVTNQASVGKGDVTMKQMKQKVERVAKDLKVNACFLIAAYYDIFRKPLIGSFEYIQKLFPIPITKDNCFYCGDMVGLGGSKKVSDANFARNCDIPIYHPKAFFQAATLLPVAPFPYPPIIFDPKTIPVRDVEKTKISVLSPSIKEIVLLIGSPASGKSTFSKNYFCNYVRINQDTLGTIRKCEKMASKMLESGKSVVIDNTNGSVKTRKIWTKLASQFGVPIRAIVLDSTKELVFHLNAFRTCGLGEECRHVPAVAIHSFFAKYEPPMKEEGFESIIHIPFGSQPLETEEEKKYFYMITY